MILSDLRPINWPSRCALGRFAALLLALVFFVAAVEGDDAFITDYCLIGDEIEL